MYLICTHMYVYLFSYIIFFILANFRSLEAEGKDAKEDAVFKQQRQANIAEVSRVKEIKAKSFGGRKDVRLLFMYSWALLLFIDTGILFLV